MRAPRTTFLLAVSIFLAAGAPEAGAQTSTDLDILVLRNGSELEGRIVRDTGEAIVLEIPDPRGYMTFPYRTLHSVNGIPSDEITRVRGLAAALRTRLGALRGMEPMSPPRTFVVTESAMQSQVYQHLETLFPDPITSQRGQIWSAMAIVRDPGNLRSKIIGLLSTRYGAIYEPNLKSLTLVIGGDEDLSQGAAHMDAFYRQLNLSREEVLVAREVVRSLQDEVYDVGDLQVRGRDSLDERLAAQAVVDGDASFLSLAFLLGELSATPIEAPNLGALAALLPESDEGAWKQAPEFLQGILLFPSRGGATFLQQVYTAGGWHLVNQVSDDLPTTTEQILHPERLLVERDEPVRILLSDLTPLLGAKTRFLTRDTLGEYVLLHLLRRYLSPSEAAAAAAGWDGDRLAAYQNEDTDAVSVAWMSAWDSEKDAQEFYKAFQTVISNSTQAPPSQDGRFTTTWKQPASGVGLEIRGSSVAAVYGVAWEQVRAALDTVWQSTQSPPEMRPYLAQVPADRWARAVQERVSTEAGWDALGKRPIPVDVAASESDGVCRQPAFGMRLPVPAGWKVSESLQPGYRLRVEEPRFQAYFQIEAYDFPVATTPRLIALIQSLRDAAENTTYSKISQGSVPVGGRDAEVVAFQLGVPRADRSILLWEMRRVYLPVGDRLFLIEYGAPAAAFQDVQAALESILTGIQFEHS